MLDTKQCKLVGQLGIVIQVSLLLICSMALLYKRQIEIPRRSFLIFSLDLGKQGVAQMCVHLTNVLISSNKKYECATYLFISTFDTFVGLGVNLILLKMVTWAAESYGMKTFLTGDYFKNPNPLNKEVIENDVHSEMKSMGRYKMSVDYQVWSVQVGVWCAIVLVSKFVMYLAEVRLDFAIYLIHLLLESLPNTIKIILVLVVVPACLNCVMVWIQDSLLKKKKFTEEEKECLYNFFYEGEDLFDDDTMTINTNQKKGNDERDRTHSIDLSDISEERE